MSIMFLMHEDSDLTGLDCHETEMRRRADKEILAKCFHVWKLSSSNLFIQISFNDISFDLMFTL